MPAITSMSAAPVRPYPKTAPMTQGARAVKTAVAGTTRAALERSAYEMSRRTAARSPSEAAPLIRGIRAVTRETVMMPWGTIHSW